MVQAVKDRGDISWHECLKLQRAEDGEHLKAYLNNKIPTYARPKTVSFFDAACEVYGHMDLSRRLSFDSYIITSKVNLLVDEWKAKGEFLAQEVAEEIVLREYPVVHAYMHSEIDELIMAIPSESSYRFACFWASGAHNATRVHYYLGGMPYFVVDWEIPGVIYEGTSGGLKEVR